MEQNKTNKFKASWRQVLQFVFHYWRPNTKVGLISAAFMVASVAIDAIMPIFTGAMIDALVSNADRVTALHAVWLAFAGYLICSSTQKIFRQTAVWFWNKFAIKNLQAIVIDGMRKVQRFSSDWHANTFAGGTVRKITRGMWSFDMFEDTVFMGLLPAVTIMIGTTVMLSIKLPSIGIATAAMVFTYCAISIWMSVRMLAPRFRESSDADTAVGASLSDVITSNATVKSFGSEDREENKFRSVIAVWRGKATRAWHMNLVADGVRSIMRMIMAGSMIATAIWLWSVEKATPGDITLVITTFSILGGYLLDIGQHISHLQRSVSDMEDVIGYWFRVDEVVDVTNAQPLRITKDFPRENLIEFDDVAFKYPNSIENIYEGMNVQIASGEKLALVGFSGSGKSTFVKLIQRLYNVTGGTIRINGQDIAKASLESLRRSIALVPQDPILFHRTLSENIAYGHPEATAQMIEDAARKAFAHDFIVRLPKGYDTIVGERGVKLSGGERQRVAIARAILSEAPILILDEATSSLDSISEHYIQQALEELMKGRTTITIAHRMSTIQNADRILVFDQGKIIEQGSHDELMSQPDLRYRKLYEMQTLGMVDDGALADVGDVRIAS